MAQRRKEREIIEHEGLRLVEWDGMGLLRTWQYFEKIYATKRYVWQISDRGIYAKGEDRKSIRKIFGNRSRGRRK
jgi:hypothetical protein